MRRRTASWSSSSWRLLLLALAAARSRTNNPMAVSFVASALPRAAAFRGVARPSCRACSCLTMMGKGGLRKKTLKLRGVAAPPPGAGQAFSSKQAQLPMSSKQQVSQPKAEFDVDKEPESTRGYAQLFEHYLAVKAPRQLITKAREAATKENVWDCDLAATSMLQLFQLGRPDLAREVFELSGANQWAEFLCKEGVAQTASRLVRASCKANDPVLAQDLMRAGRLLVSDTSESEDPPAELVTVRAQVYPALVSAWFRSTKADGREGMARLEDMAKAKIAMSVEAANGLIRSAQKRRDLPAVFALLDAMTSAGVVANDETYEVVANAAVRSVDFVTGAVSMETLPRKWMPEAAFIGRSNVGKSSLINMVCNRKALAYASKRPGKTQQLNYFAVNADSDNSFYIVDMPGVGYAKVPGELRREWEGLFRSYISSRASLRVLFHLVDGRHGPLGEDLAVMELMRDLRPGARYVLVLTKADKRQNSVSRIVIDKTIAALREAGVPRTPIIATSASSKLGRDDMWRYLRLAALDVSSPHEQHDYGKKC
jgi:ribosome biogenesis GTP-binding protein YsxC/EngB